MISKILLASAIGDAFFRVLPSPYSRESTLRFNEQRERERTYFWVFGFDVEDFNSWFLKVFLLEASSPLYYSSSGEVIA
jgi:hypothetical protein